MIKHFWSKYYPKLVSTSSKHSLTNFKYLLEHSQHFCGAVTETSDQQQAQQFLEQLDDQQNYRTSFDVELEPGLYVVSTPIGHLEDITLRALNTLKAVHGVLAEDTRRSSILLQKYKISKPMVSYHVFNEKARTYQIIKRLQRGESLALVSDAGTPGISDPGYLLIQGAIDAGVKIIPIPGPCSAITALVASGLPTNEFYFVGFLPSKQPARVKNLTRLQWIEATLIYFCPARELLEVLGDMAEVFGKKRRCCVAREMTKIHEDFFRGSLYDAVNKFDTESKLKGEITIMVEGRTMEVDTITDEQLQVEIQFLLQQGTLASVAAKQLALEHGISKRKVYNIATQIKQQLMVQANEQQQQLLEEG